MKRRNESNKPQIKKKKTYFGVVVVTIVVVVFMFFFSFDTSKHICRSERINCVCYFLIRFGPNLFKIYFYILATTTTKKKRRCNLVSTQANLFN